MGLRNLKVLLLVMINLDEFKNIFLDRDGIVNQVIEREGVISSPRVIEEFFLREDFLDFTKIKLLNLGLILPILLIISFVPNMSSIAITLSPFKMNDCAMFIENIFLRKLFLIFNLLIIFLFSLCWYSSW